MGLATPVRAAAFTLALVVVPTPARVAGLTPARAGVNTLGRAAAPTLVPVVAPIPVPVAVHTLVLAVVPTPVLVVGLTLVPEGLVTPAPEAAILTNGTAHLQTASEKGKMLCLYSMRAKFKTSGLHLPLRDTPKTILN